MKPYTHGPSKATLKKYNLTAEQWWLLFADGHCPGCKKAYRWDDPNRRACVDHDHKTYRIRGMLCAACNYEWGCLRENVDWLEAMADYARNPPARRLLSSVPLVSNAPPIREND